MPNIFQNKYSALSPCIQQTIYEQKDNLLITTTSFENSQWNITLIPCLESNYAFILWHKVMKQAVVIDVPDAVVIDAFLTDKALMLTQIWITHHHNDHVGGTRELLRFSEERGNRPTLYYPALEEDKIMNHIADYDLKTALSGDDSFNLGNLTVSIIDASGHTVGHIAYKIEEKSETPKVIPPRIFVGDALFSLGCGYLFKGMAKEMKESFDRLTAQTAQTQIFCSHEYTQNNGKFVLSIDPLNLELHLRIREVETLRAEGKPTLPTTIQREKQTNPFLRLQDRHIRKSLGLDDTLSEIDVFQIMREAKNQFPS